MLSKTCLIFANRKSNFLCKHARFFREGKHAISQENLPNESLRNCDVRQVLCILTIFCRFQPKNVCILPKFSSFQSFQSKIILVKCCKEVIVPPEYFFEFSMFKCEYFCGYVCVHSSYGSKSVRKLPTF